VELAAGLLISLPAPAPVERIIGITTRIGWRPTAAQGAFLAVLRQVGKEMQS
jgi:LysR family transcriptional regulator of gallate degradation